MNNNAQPHRHMVIDLNTQSDIISTSLIEPNYSLYIFELFKINMIRLLGYRCPMDLICAKIALLVQIDLPSKRFGSHF